MSAQARSARRALRAAVVVAATALCLAAIGAQAATINVIYLDPSDGFHSVLAPDPASPAPGASLGAQRRASFEAAAADWANRLASNVPIDVEAEMVPLSCSSFQAVLGAAGTNFVEANWSPGPGGISPPFVDTWYHSALAEKIANVDLSGGADIGSIFNSRIDDNDDCLTGTNWYYALGPGGAPLGTISFYDVVLHEIGHGVGVSTFVNLSAGSRFMGLDDIYMRFLEDHSLGLTWDQMTDQQRSDSAVDTDDLHWVGPAVQGASGVLDDGADGTHVRLYAPPSLSAGSSVSHFDVSLNAAGDNELMEPFATGSAQILVTDELLTDEGWGPVLGGVLCGNSVIDGNEGCDDGAQVDGDGCNSICQVEQCYTCAGEPSTCSPQTGPTCDDGQQCTTDVCNAGVCESTPETGTACDDGLTCSTDVCDAGVCVGDLATCTLDPFKLYKVKKRKGGPVFAGATVDLGDGFENRTVDAVKAQYYGNPATVEGAPVSIPEVHMVCYRIRDSKSTPGQPKFVQRDVTTSNPFGTETLTVVKPTTLCLPSSKGDELLPPPLPFHLVDPFKCYKVKTAQGAAKFVRQSIALSDELESKQTRVLVPTELCAPVDVDGGGILDASGHLECYKIVDDKDTPGQPRFTPVDGFTRNDFGAEGLIAVKPQRLCVPSTKSDP